MGDLIRCDEKYDRETMQYTVVFEYGGVPVASGQSGDHGTAYTIALEHFMPWLNEHLRSSVAEAAVQLRELKDDGHIPELFYLRVIEKVHLFRKGLHYD